MGRSPGDRLLYQLTDLPATLTRRIRYGLLLPDQVSEPTCKRQVAGHRSDTASGRWGRRRCAPADTGTKIPFDLPIRALRRLARLACPAVILLISPIRLTLLASQRILLAHMLYKETRRVDRGHASSPRGFLCCSAAPRAENGREALVCSTA